MNNPTENEDTILCKICNKKSKNKKCFAKHMLLYKEPRFTCEICSVYKTYRKLEFRLHQKSKHNVGEGTGTSCLFCNKEVQSFVSLERHLRSHTKERAYLCKFCPKEYCQQNEQKFHMNNHDSGKTAKFICQICSKSFVRKPYLAQHLRIHIGEKPYQCEICSKGFVHKGHLDSHKRIHSNEKPYKCEICDARFPQPQVLKTHIRFHTKEKPFTCEICKKKFSLKQRFMVHCRIHTGDKPYACEICGKQFSESTTLKNHIRTHTGEKPYSCNKCGRTFTQNSNLREHMTRWHNMVSG